MKFIRVHGRVIPVREKGDPKGKQSLVNKAEDHLTKQDVSTGFFLGAVNGLLFKRKLGQVFGIASLIQGAGTTNARLRMHDSTGKAIKEDFKSSLLKMGAGAVGSAAGVSAAVAGRKISKSPASSNFFNKVGGLFSRKMTTMKKTADLSRSSVKTFKTTGRTMSKIAGLLK